MVGCEVSLVSIEGRKASPSNSNRSAKCVSLVEYRGQKADTQHAGPGAPGKVSLVEYRGQKLRGDEAH